ncbi:MAG: DegV family protein [Firmicutes bacterium]|nr:DegV family protein [Bacillota bacterium]
MSKIKIITDSTSDIPRNIIEKYDITVLPLTVLFGEEEYKDWVDITPSDFFKRMRETEKLPTTSMVTPNEFSKAYETYLKEYDEIISIHLSSNASGTYNSALLAKEMTNKDKIFVIDTKNYTYGYGQFVVEAAKMASDEKSSSEIIEKLKYFNENLKTLFVVDTLEYLKKGGRLSATKATIGTLLNLKPILTVKEGKIIAIDKARGFKKALKRIAEIIQEEGSDLKDQILKVKVGHADNYEHLEIFKNVLEENFGKCQFEEFEVGCVIGVYCGPGTVVIHYF